MVESYKREMETSDTSFKTRGKIDAGFVSITELRNGIWGEKSAMDLSRLQILRTNAKNW